MDPTIFKFVHYIGILTLFFSLGAMFSGASWKKSFGMGHGIGLLLIIISGFGFLGVAKLGIPVWAIVKTIIWLFFGASLALAKKGKLKGLAAWVVIIGLGSAAAFIGLNWKTGKLPAFMVKNLVEKKAE
ncbi:hypothetical protein [Persicirhabdus sediminis]|uniref:Uncharacterized protein n=1 Tax=Persicirhabdus sediminis TaxID=454144 RepID=A0A8J7SIM5_9BACT|nr:hypothetical protein [Persicirhabdus sediminis]MBK1791565.1 hypothetical protein [Persicirhabdus sediminis]